MPSIKPFPTLILRLEGGPDDGETRLMLAVVAVVPPERLEPSTDAPGVYVRQPQLDAPWTWRDRGKKTPAPRGRTRGSAPALVIAAIPTSECYGKTTRVA
jgi:hypothetical protein